MRALWLAAAVLLAMPVPDVRADEPVAGGRYVDRSRDHGARVHIKLTLANDGKQFAVPSFAIVSTPGLTVGVGITSGNPADEIPDAAVLPGGQFEFARYGSEIRGRFIRQGRLAVGRVIRRYLGDRVSVRFRARLTGTPNAARPGKPSHCDRVTIRYDNRKRADDGYEPVEQGLGCTTARGLARAWHASAACGSLPGPGSTCTVGESVCERIVGGIWRARASVRCSIPNQPSTAAEFVYQEACRPPPYDGDGDFALWAINLDCATARSLRIDEFIDAPNPPCGSGWGKPAPDWCTSVAGYTCGARDFVGPVSGYNALCVQDADRFRALRLEFDGGI
jgi:hypothetical protein